MGSIFRPKTTVVNVPSQSQAQGSSKIEPFEPVVPFIKEQLPDLVSEFRATPELFRESLVPQDSAQTLAAREGYTNLAQNVIPGFTNAFTNVFANRLNTALSDPTQDPIFQAERGVIADEARSLTERDKLLAQQQAINAGQFGLGSTALGELETLQQRQREESTRNALATALKDAEIRRTAALADVPGLGQTALQAATTPSALLESVGKDVEGRDRARLADQARLAQQDQEARRAQAVTLTNLLGGLAGLGSQTQFTQSQSGTQGQAFSGPSPFSQVAGSIGTVASLIPSDYRVKENIQELPDGALDKINALSPKSYNYKEGLGLSTKHTSGFIAHELQEVMPEYVQGGKDGSAVQMVDVMGVVSTLTKAVQELARKVEKLEAGAK
jgi:hypothetical protein